MQHGHPKKSKCNISGLHVSDHAVDILEPDEDLVVDLEFENLELRHAVALDGLKVNFEREYEVDSTMDELDIGEEFDLEFLDDEEFRQKFLEMAEKEDGQDADWIPEQLQRKWKKSNSAITVPHIYQASSVISISSSKNSVEVVKSARWFVSVESTLKDVEEGEFCSQKIPGPGPGKQWEMKKMDSSEPTEGAEATMMKNGNTVGTASGKQGTMLCRLLVRDCMTKGSVSREPKGVIVVQYELKNKSLKEWTGHIPGVALHVKGSHHLIQRRE
ncbi:hypothetical protein EDC04DRAFT_2606125 [Pisolithus marmoratus]|nr:hypothetical protein EDC04DRAFT_2606125 [Pisolithus marmoratus]